MSFFYKSIIRLFNFNAMSLSGARVHGKKYVAIYFDRGVSIGSILGLIFNFKQLINGKNYQLKLVDGDHLRYEPWEDKTALLVMPGGRARPYYKSLGAIWESENVAAGETRKLKEIGIGNQRIKDFVSKGGKYLGICAGGYYATQLTVFEKDGPLEVLDEGALNFFPGFAEGPAYGLGKFSYYNKRGARLAKTSYYNLKENKERTGLVYYNGGCFFKPFNQTEQISTLAVYDDIEGKPAAVVKCNFGKGKVILSGVHFEMNHWLFPLQFLFRTIFYLSLKEHANFQFHILTQFLGILLDNENRNDVEASEAPVNSCRV